MNVDITTTINRVSKNPSSINRFMSECSDDAFPNVSTRLCLIYHQHLCVSCRLNRHRSLEYIREPKRQQQRYQYQNNDDRQLVRSKSVMAERDVRDYGNDVDYPHGGRDDVCDFFPSSWNDVYKYVKQKLPSVDMPVGRVDDNAVVEKNMDQRHVWKQTRRNPEPER